MAIALYLILTCVYICYNEEHFYDDSVLADWDDSERAYTKKISLFPGL